FANFLNETTGSIEVGKLADLVVLERNLLTIPAFEISDAKVLATYLEGRQVYAAPD
ncbi:MAG: putative amidohydrolase YtcJ, partial [Bacteroidia bacterium]